MTFEQAALLPVSEKITLVTMLAEKRAKLFELHAPNVYKKSVDYFVELVKYQGVEMEEAPSLALIDQDQYYYSHDEKLIYIRLLGNANPETEDVSIVYRFHFSNAPIILPSDLASGNQVEWLPYVDSIGNLGQALDDENKGIVLESSSSVSLINQGYFDDIFDTMLWENKSVSFYYWFPITPISEARKIFDGIIDSKSYSPDKVSFNVKDFIFKLRNTLDQDLFSELDGSVLESFIGKPKRRVYGRVNKLRCVPLDAVKDGFQITGTISATTASKQVTGTGTLFLDELSADDEITIIQNNEEVRFTIDYIQSDTVLFVTDEPNIDFTNFTATVLPTIPWRKKNREWHIAGHKLRKTSVEILNVIDGRRFEVDDVSELFPDDVVVLNNVTTQITRISGNQVILEQFIFPLPIAGDFIEREPVQAAYFKNKKLLLNRDFTVSNISEAILELDELAEFNIARERLSSNAFSFAPVQLTFTNGQKIVSTAAEIDLKTIIKPRDWIRSTVQLSDVWFEVVKVEERAIILRQNYTQATNTNVARIKNVEIINDDSLITVDCYGMDRNDKWIKTASDAVKDMMVFDAAFTPAQLNLDTFTQANDDCSYILSLALPEDAGGEEVLIRDAVTKINDSVFGSLYGDATQNICYSILNTRRPASIQPLKDDDILGWSSESSNEIVNQIVARYGHFIDTVKEEPAANYITYSNEFVDKYSKIKRTKEIDVWLYNESEAETIAQRIAFYNSLSQLKVVIKGKALFFNYSVNDRIYISLDRLYKRYGSGSRLKIGIVSSKKVGLYDSEIVLNDIGNIFNRVPVIAPNSTQSFDLASEDDKVKYGFILDDDLLIPGSSEDDLGCCLIG